MIVEQPPPEPPEDPVYELVLQPSPGAEFETSPSDVAIYELCPRKWAWRSIDGVVPEKKPGAALGTKIHAIIEDWLKYRRFDWSKEGAAVAAQIIRHLPPPQVVDPAGVEMHVAIMIGGIRFNMTLDLIERERKPPKVYDHKSTSDFCWAVAEDDMTNDVQVTLYAAYGLRETKAEAVEVQWTYGRTRGPAVAEPRSRVLRGRDIMDRVNKTIESAHEMRELHRTAKSALDVVYNAGACSAFGGCPFTSLCNLTEQEQMESIMTQGFTKAGFIDTMKERAQNGAQGVNPPPLGHPAPAVSAAPSQYGPPQQQPQQQPQQGGGFIAAMGGPPQHAPQQAQQYPPQQAQPAPQQHPQQPQQPQQPLQYPPQQAQPAPQQQPQQAQPAPQQYPQQPAQQPYAQQQHPVPSTAPPVGGGLLDKLRERSGTAGPGAPPAAAGQQAPPGNTFTHNTPEPPWSARLAWTELAKAALPVAVQFAASSGPEAVVALTAQLADALSAEAARRFGS